MTIATELQAYNDGLLDAYDAVDAKGGTIPANKNLDNLPTAIGTISGGGGGGGALDPEQVYRDTRPTDWLVMPEIGENDTDVAYFLLMVGEDRTEDIPFRMTVSTGSTGGITTYEFGTTDSSGTFTPISALSETKTGQQVNYGAAKLPMSAFGNPTSDGKKQVICKIAVSGTGGRLGGLEAGSSSPSGIMTRKMLHEFRGKTSATTCSLTFMGNSDGPKSARNLAYFDFLGGAISNCNAAFYNCPSLVAVLHLNTTGITSFNQMFYYCYSLTAIPQLDTSSGTTFSNTFAYCTSLVTIPQLDISSGTIFYQTFAYCYSLHTIPQLDLSSATRIDGMFYYCYSLTAIPQLDTSSVTDFSTAFAYCHSLTAIPQLDTSSGTKFANMFNECGSLTVADLTRYDFSAATSFYSFLSNTAIGLTVELGDEWPAAGIPTTSTSFSYSGTTVDNTAPLRIKINKTDAMLSLNANATTVFSTGTYVYVYVPDALLATYQADTYWSTLGARLKGFSELPS